MRGGVPLLTMEVIETAEKLGRMGHSPRVVGDFVGISPRSVERWLQRGREEIARVETNPRARVRQSEALYVELCRRYTRARASSRLDLIGTMLKAANAGDWKAAAWVLARTNPGEYPDTGPVTPTVGTEAVVTQIVTLLGGKAAPRPPVGDDDD